MVTEILQQKSASGSRLYWVRITLGLMARERERRK
jgi:hypothetical protein